MNGWQQLKENDINKDNKHHHEIYNAAGKLCHNYGRACLHAVTKKIELIDFSGKESERYEQ